MATIGNLEVRIGAVTKDFNAGIRSAAAKLDEFEGRTNKMSRSMSNFGDRLRGIGTNMSKWITGPLTIAGGAAVTFATQFAQTGDQVAKTADKLGVGVEALQELRFAAERSGVAADTFDMALQRFTRRAAEAAEGTGEAKDALAQLGIQLRDQDGSLRNSEELLGDVADAFRRIEDPAERVRLAFKLFDSEGVAMVNMLRDGNSAIEEMRGRFRELGLGMTEETARASEQLVDQMAELRGQLAAVGTVIAAELIPFLSDHLVPAIQEDVIPAMRSIGETIGGVIDWFSQLPGPVQEAAAVIAGALGAGGPVVVAVGVLSKVLAGLIAATGPIGLFIAAASLAFAAWQQWGDQITALMQDVGTFLTEKWTMLRDTAVEIWTSMGDAILNAILAPYNRIKEATAGLAEGIVGVWQTISDTLVGGSIIPDMMDKIEAEFGRLDGTVGQNERAAAAIAQTWQKTNDATRRSISTMADDALGTLGNLFRGSKAIAIAQALVNTWKGVSETLAFYPWPWAGIMAAAHAAAGLANVASIRSASEAGGGGGAGGGAAAGASARASQAQMSRQQPQAPAPDRRDISIVVQGDTFSREQLIRLVEEMNGLMGDGMRLRTS